MRRTLLASLTILALHSPAYADATEDAAFIATQTVTTEMMRGTFEVLGPVVAQAIDHQLSQNGITLSDPERFVDLIAEEFEGAFLSELRAQTAALQLEVFTEDELSEIAAFYATDAGQALIRQTPTLMLRGQQIGEQIGVFALQEAGVRLAARMEEEGITFTQDPSMSERLLRLLRP